MSSERCSADVVVLANWSTERVVARLSPVTARPFDVTLDPGEVVPLFADGRSYITFDSQGTTKRYLLNANSAFRFGNLRGGGLELEEIGLNGDQATFDGRSLPGSPSTTPAATIPVKVLVDEEEPTKQFVWEPRLRRRVERASAILDKHCRLRLKVVGVGTWNSDNGTTDFFESLGEFEQEVDPFPGQLAIGFTNQYQVPTGRVHLGGTRGPFHTHILLREWSRHVGEAERLELLVHELGHHLGAVHVDAPDSVMRPVLGDRQALRAQFEIRFDPINTLVMSMIVEEVRRRHIRDLASLTPGTQRRLQQIYSRLEERPPTVPSTTVQNNVRPIRRTAVSPLVEGTQTIVQEIVRAARANHKRPETVQAGEQAAAKLTGDELTNFYVRRAAAAAQEVRESVAIPAFLYALGIALDDSDTLRTLPKTKPFATAVESTGQRSIRLAFLGEPTVRGRRDLAQHFFISSYLAALNGPEAALSAGLAKEMLDSRSGGSGFSFADMAANKAGILFAKNVSDKMITLDQLVKEFTVDAYVPSVDDLSEGLSTAQVLAQFGSAEDGRFQQQLANIDQMLQELAAYKNGMSSAPHSD